jgi:integrase/recombinase XerD
MGEMANDAPLFVSERTGKRISRDAVWKMVNRAGVRAKLHVFPHRLRTTGACLAVRNGVSAFQLKALMGHSNIRTTQRYVELAEMDLDTAVRKASPLDNL